MADPIYMQNKDHGFHIAYTSKEEAEAQKLGFKRIDMNKYIADKRAKLKGKKNAD